MNKIELKTKILEAGIAAQERILSHFRGRIDELEASETQLSDEPMDAQEQSLNGQTEETIQALARQLEMVEKEMITLKSIKPAGGEHEDVHLGSVVVTDKLRFFVSTSIEHFNVEGEEYFGLSLKAPIYKTMAGKKKGESFSCNGITYKIKDLF